jgi:2-deoxy-D-gluconate 3-dehydrogenase
MKNRPNIGGPRGSQGRRPARPGPRKALAPVAPAPDSHPVDLSRSNLFDVRDKVILVTGGSRGLGLALARGLAGLGARVAVVSRQRPAGREADLHFFPADLLRPRAAEGLVAKVAGRMGGLDVLIHSAGQVHRQAAIEYPLGPWDELFRLHVRAGFDLAQQAAGIMQPRGGGKIIMISSILGFQGGLHVPAYSAAKHAVNGLVKALCNEWAPHRINVNAIAPGYFDTELARPLLRDPVRGRAIRARIPAGRPGRPEELLGAAVFLASAASDYVHGHTLVVDGGWLAR